MHVYVADCNGAYIENKDSSLCITSDIFDQEIRPDNAGSPIPTDAVVVDDVEIRGYVLCSHM